MGRLTSASTRPNWRRWFIHYRAFECFSDSPAECVGDSEFSLRRVSRDPLGRTELLSFVDFSTMTDGVNNNRSLVSQDLENNSVRSISEFVESAQLSFQRIEFRGFQISGEPLNSVSNPPSGGLIEFLKFAGGRF